MLPYFGRYAEEESLDRPFCLTCFASFFFYRVFSTFTQVTGVSAVASAEAPSNTARFEFECQHCTTSHQLGCSWFDWMEE